MNFRESPSLEIGARAQEGTRAVAGAGVGAREGAEALLLPAVETLSAGPSAEP